MEGRDQWIDAGRCIIYANTCKIVSSFCIHKIKQQFIVR